MERDCLIGYGASMLLLERLMISSDEFTVRRDLLHCQDTHYHTSSQQRDTLPVLVVHSRSLS